jgi:L-arabinokinase
MRALEVRDPDGRIIVRTHAAGWLFERAAPASIERHAIDVDPGVVQIGALRIDEDATVRAARAFYASFDERADAEAAWLSRAGADVVVGDVPPLAFAAAARAGIPSVAISNFTWDWIYEAYGGFAREAPHVLPVIAQAYAHATRTLRLPLHGGFASMTRVEELPLVARLSLRDPGSTRRALGVSAGQTLVLVSFGGSAVELPLDRVRRSGRLAVLAPQHADLPDDLGFEDLVAAADVVVGKPGYGIMSECAANGASLLYTSRGRFAEYDVFVAGMPALLRCRYIPQADLFGGRWTDAIDALLAQPRPERPRADGADRAAERILESVRR